MTSPNRKRLLIAYAHPDDESFGLGGLIGKYVAEGVEVYLICATDGDVGTIAPEHMRGFDTVRDVRLAELEACNQVLKFTKIFTLGYKDSGMMHSEFNQDPACLWYAHEHTPEQVTRRVVEVIREVKPHVVITFNKYGGYGHPDHIAIQSATTDAFTLASDASYDTGQAPYKSQKLYYSNIPRSMIQLGIWLIRLRGQDPRKVGRNQDIDIQAILDNCEPTHTRVDIRHYFEIWDEASACHLSQGGGGGFRIIPKWLRRYVTPHQGFTRIVPKPRYDKVDEYDMFEQVTVD